MELCWWFSTLCVVWEIGMEMLGCSAAPFQHSGSSFVMSRGWWRAFAIVPMCIYLVWHALGWSTVKAVCSWSWWSCIDLLEQLSWLSHGWWLPWWEKVTGLLWESLLEAQPGTCSSGPSIDMEALDSTDLMQVYLKYCFIFLAIELWLLHISCNWTLTDVWYVIVLYFSCKAVLYSFVWLYKIGVFHSEGSMKMVYSNFS